MSPRPKSLPQDFDTVGWKGLMNAVSGATAQEGLLLDADNVEMVLGDLRRARKLKNFSATTLAGLPLAIIPYQLANGTYKLVIPTSEKVYGYTSAAVGFVEIGTYTGAASRNAFWSLFGGSLLFTDGVNPVQTYDGTTLAALGGLTDVIAKSLATFWSFVFLFHTTESSVACPHRVRWSNVGDSTAWASGLADFVDLLDSYGEVQTGLPLGNKLLVYKDRAIYSGSYIGLPQVFDWNLLTAKIGILAPNTLAEFGGMHFFLGHDNVYVYNGFGDPTPIGEPIIEEILGPRRTSAAQYMNRAFGFYVTWLREYWLMIPGGTGEYPVKLFRFHTPSQTWWPRHESSGWVAAGEWLSADPVTWNDIAVADTWNDFGVSETWNELGGVAQNLFTPLIGVPSGVGSIIQELDETEPTTSEAYYVSKDYLFPIATRILEYRIEAKGALGQLTAYYSTNEGDNWTSLGTKTLSGDEWQWSTWTLNLVTNVIRFKVVLEAADVSLRKRSIVGIEKRR